MSFWGHSVHFSQNGRYLDNGWQYSETLDSGVLVTYIWGTFDLLVFKVILGPFGSLVSIYPVPGKRLAVEKIE